MMHADVINASFSFATTLAADAGCGHNTIISEVPLLKFIALRDGLTKAFAELPLSQSLLVVAAGNCGIDLDAPYNFAWPASFNKNGLVVGGTTLDTPDALAESNFGATIDLGAPSQDFTCLVPPSLFGTTTAPCGFGTSYAAPLVSGTAALLASISTANACQFADLIIRNSDTVRTGSLLPCADAGVCSVDERCVNGVCDLNQPLGVGGFRRLNADRAIGDSNRTSVRTCP